MYRQTDIKEFIDNFQWRMGMQLNGLVERSVFNLCIDRQADNAILKK